MISKNWIYGCLVGACSWGASAQISETLEWRAPYFPPFYNHTSAEQQGALDPLLDSVIERLPGYKHQLIQSNYRRLLYDMKSDKAICSHALVKTQPRSEYIRFSEPLLPMFPPGIVMIVDKYRQLAPLTPSAAISVELDSLLTHSKLSLGFLSGRTYGAEVDKILARLAKDQQAHVVRFEGMSNVGALLKMLSLDRLDMIMAYPSEAHHFSAMINLEEEFRFITVKEQPRHLMLRFACADTQQGRRVIEKIDRIILKTDLRQQARDAYLDTLLPSVREDYRRYWGRCQHQEFRC